jgi:hypothetical protein
MLRRILILALLLVIVAGTAGLAPQPASAAPAKAVQDAPNAALLPADTALYFDFKVGDLNKVTGFIGGLYQKIMGTPMPDIYAEIDRGLSQGLKRDASFAKDIQPWLGDHISVGVRITDEQMTAIEGMMKDPSAPMSQGALMPQYFVIVAVKDDAAAQKFLDEVIAKAKEASPSMSSAVTTRTDTVNGAPATIYDQGGSCGTNCASFVIAKGFLMVGPTVAVNGAIEGYKSNAPKLDADPTFTKMLGALKPNNLLTFYMNPRLYAYYFAMQAGMMRNLTRNLSETPEANDAPPADPMKPMRALLSAIQGQAFGLRLEDKLIALDVAQGFDPKALEAAYAELGYPADLIKTASGQAIAYKVANQIPAKALAVVTAQGLGNLYKGLREGLKNASKIMAAQGMGQFGSTGQFDQISGSFEKGEAALELAFDLNVDEDILSWMTGEFALFLNYSQRSDLGGKSGNPVPFDVALLIDSTDAAKTKSFIEKLNAGLTKNKVTPESKGTDLFTVTHENAPTIGYGLVGNTFFVTNGSGLDAAVAAIKGDGTIANDPTWKNAQSQAVNPAAQFWYINLGQLSTIIKALAPADQLGKTDNMRFMTLLDQFESFSISSGVVGADNLILGNAQLILK